MTTKAGLIAAASDTLHTGPRLFASLEAGATVFGGPDGEVVPDSPGLYAVVAQDPNVVQTELRLDASASAGDVLYIGKAEDSLRKRQAGKHFADGGTARSTLRRTLAALLVDRLDLKPLAVASAGRFTLTPESGEQLTIWMRRHLAVRVWQAPAGFAEVTPLGGIEKSVIDTHTPPLNLTYGGTSPEAQLLRQRIRKARTAMAEQAKRGVDVVQADSSACATVGDLFRRRPRQYGLRGSIGLWEELAERLDDTPMPTSEYELGRLLHDALERSLEGAEPYDEDKVNVERFNRGGMSQGLVHLPWWEDQAIPLLLDRWGAWADTQGLLGPEDFIGSW
ncbi:GIY-YIG nuclease family protein [Micrococcus endophyticus]|uniref:GIY-YIG catalytic domain-containing protein n=1 Tax=Micrococcus endophyticus TaxID=455343 RepID=A0A7W9JKA7_9MICC|nr:hypothetical protein [Micrococcus endophyticus]MBB5849442.1 hypothetical protein [Micrococcus endophyticus]